MASVTARLIYGQATADYGNTMKFAASYDGTNVNQTRPPRRPPPESGDSPPFLPTSQNPACASKSPCRSGYKVEPLVLSSLIS